MSSTLLKQIEEANKNNREWLKKLHEKDKRRDKERALFLEMQKHQCFIENLSSIAEFEDYDIDAQIIRGEFHILFEKNVFCFEPDQTLYKGNSTKPANEHDLILISGKSDVLKRHQKNSENT